MNLPIDLTCAVVLDFQELFGRGMASVLLGTKIVQRARLVRNFDELASVIETESRTLVAVIDSVALGSDGPAIIRKLRHKYSTVRFVVVGNSSNRIEILSYLASGAHGFILKTQTAKEIVSAITVVLSGNIFVPPMVCDLESEASTADSLDQPDKVEVSTTEDVIDTAENNGWLQDRIARLPLAPGIQLSLRQQTILRLISKGLPNKAIARELGLAESTVKVHINNMFKALKVNNRIEAVARAGWHN